MTTNYTLSDRAPKDIDGAKFWSLVNTSVSQLDFALPMGIGERTIYSKTFASLGIGTHSLASKVEAGAVGVALMGVYLDDSDTSKVANGQAQLIKSSRKGELFTTGACKLALVNATSVNTYTLGSGLLHGGYITGTNVNLGDTVRIESNTTTVFNVVFSATSQTHVLQIPPGGIYFSSSIIHRRTIGANGATSVVLFVERP